MGMRVLSILLENYKPFYNGMRLNKIYIDFRKCKYNKVIIIGDNGSGKSTLEHALNPLPDSNSLFIEGVVAKKVIEYQSGDTVYTITYIHRIKANGERDVAKGYFAKTIGNHTEELNPNGNITSCKDLIFEEFDLDPSYLALSQLSSDDRGLADKTPAERKSCLNSIVAALETYNGIYKKMNKKSLAYKSIMKSLAQDISNLGNIESLNSTLKSLDHRIKSMENDRSNMQNSIAVAQDRIVSMDPDRSIQNEYSMLMNDISSTLSEMKTMDTQISILLSDLNLSSLDTLDGVRSLKSQAKIDIEYQITMIETNINTLLNNREQEAKELQKKTQKLSSITNDCNYSELVSSIRILNENIAKYEAIFDEIGLKDATILTKDEYVIGLNILKEIKETVDVFRESQDFGVIDETVNNFINQNIDPVREYQELQSKLEEVNNLINIRQRELDQVEMEKSVLSDLNLRPDECHIDTCPFIKKAVEVQRSNPDERIEFIANVLNELELTKADIEIQSDYYISICNCSNYLNSLIRNINAYSAILKKLPNGYIFSNKDVFLTNLRNGSTFNEINDLYQYLNYANIIEEYNKDIATLYQLKADQRVFASKNDIIEEIQSDIESLNRKTNELSQEIESRTYTVRNLKIALSDLDQELLRFETLSSLKSNYEKLLEKKELSTTRYDQIKDAMQQINILSQNIQTTQDKLLILEKALAPIKDDRDQCVHSIQLIKDYSEKLKIYTDKASFIDLIKKYSSPNTGIQNIFMEIYMNKIIDLSNQLLALLFDGEYVLQPFVITDKEFRIPCKGEGFINDDIKSMSTAQICMISMIISATIIYQSSTKYNIIRLDEIDGGLDYSNRLNFIYLLDKIMNILGCQQCFIVSHNNELDTERADIIRLKHKHSNEVINGNIIWDYQG